MTTQEGLDALAAVFRLLNRAADASWNETRARSDPRLASLSLGAQLAASDALRLLPEGAPVEEPAPSGTDPLELLRAAEELTRTGPIEEFPPGTSQVIVAILDLLREHTP